MVRPTNLGTAGYFKQTYLNVHEYFTSFSFMDIVLLLHQIPLQEWPLPNQNTAVAAGSMPDVIEEHSLVPTPDMDGLLPSDQT
jgi:hypothetical protein